MNRDMVNIDEHNNEEKVSINVISTFLKLKKCI